MYIYSAPVTCLNTTTSRDGVTGVTRTHCPREPHVKREKYQKLTEPQCRGYGNGRNEQWPNGINASSSDFNSVVRMQHTMKTEDKRKIKHVLSYQKMLPTFIYL
jgi:hypothetical protein